VLLYCPIHLHVHVHIHIHIHIHQLIETVGESRASKHDEPDGGTKECPVKKGGCPVEESQK